MLLFYFALLGFVLLVFLVFVAFCVSIKGLGGKAVHRAFECGFDSFGSARIPFSLSFFILALIFLVFDVEIVILFPMCLSCFYRFSGVGFFSLLRFLVVLLLGLFYEWREGALEWLGC